MAVIEVVRRRSRLFHLSDNTCMQTLIFPLYTHVIAEGEGLVKFGLATSRYNWGRCYGYPNSVWITDYDGRASCHPTQHTSLLSLLCREVACYRRRKIGLGTN